MMIIIVGVFVLSVVAFRLTNTLHLARWQVSAGLLLLGALLYVLNAYLIRFFIQRRAPQFANDRDWELTAGLGIVPKWVSALVLLAISAIITAVLPWVVALFR